MAKLVAVHQPNLFPYLGFFDKLNRADTFVVLDHVLNKANAGFWGKRVKILKKKGPDWITIPLKKPEGSSYVSINTMQIEREDVRYQSALNAIKDAYAGATHFAEIFPIIEAQFANKSELLSEWNMDFIQQMMQCFQINTQLLYSSKLNCREKAAELMIEITKLAEGTQYLNGDGASAYLDPANFVGSGIEIVQQHFSHPDYKQLNEGEFVAGMSIIDPLMNLGLEATAQLIKNPSAV